jgi:hypothetical protein
MSLVKSPKMTPRKLAAIRRNQKLSHGPATAQGRERLRAAHLRHGFYARADEAALRALGEDPAQFQDLLEGLWEKWNPTDALQERLVARLARALWLMDRADRMQEGYALRQAKDVNRGREDRLHARMMRQKMTSASLQTLAQSVARERYVTTSDDLELMKSLHREGAMREMGEMALALFHQLQAPGEEDDGEGGSDHDADIRRVVARVREIFGLGASAVEPEADAASVSPRPLPDREAGAGSQEPAGRQGPSQNSERIAEADTAGAGVTAASSDAQGSEDVRSEDSDGVHRTPEIGEAGASEQEEEEPNAGLSSAEWEAREPVRRLLEHILSRQVEICEAERQATLRESLMGPSPYERAAEIAPTQRNAALMRRMQDSSFRQVVRLTSLLMRMKRQERQMEGLENPAACYDLSETKGVSNRNENLPKLHPVELKRVNLLRAGGGGGEKRGPQNEGKSNDVVENKGRKNVSLGF